MLSDSSLEDMARLVTETVYQILPSLRVEAVQVDGNFHLFSVGRFDSLSFIQLLMNIEQKFGRKLDLSVIDFNKIETLGALVSQLYKIAQRSMVERML